MTLKRIFLSALFLALLAPSLGMALTKRVPHPRPASVRHNPSAPAIVLTQVGWSSWYGPEMKIKSQSHGKVNVYHRMANGEYFDPTRLTAASRTLPLGTMARVVNLQTGRSVVVEITDRGPFTKGRILDLAEAAAERIGCRGLCHVLLEPTGPELALESADTSKLVVPLTEGARQ